ncbi:ras-specific guanine nucleotide-releasing factor 2-like [Ylistrum balloti]|uniref:ras-specific guanine nucleotide-releasing factor 2-like n=1 Tax=Ylistrum balloti TaxID=509963 RepID=UPI002905B995|nr:ras-specific guanine nucleotide-releasing factor 2-like [Ylistrum balloti]
MQKAIRFNENQLLYLASKSRRENTIAGYLHKKSSDTGKWQLRYFILYQNLLFYFESETAGRPSGVALLEGSYCDRVLTPAALKAGKDTEKQTPLVNWGGYRLEYCFTITYKSEGQRQYDLRTDTESECNAWIDHIKRAPYSKVLEQKEELEQKHLHLLQILESERQAKWHYVQQTEELAQDVKKLRAELAKFKKDRVAGDKQDEETDELKKIKKVQSFFRGWLCRRRWKQIVELYIRSPHAESMRKRNSIVFNMVECEEEYNRQLSTLVTCFLRPLRMAASSKKPPITHDDVNSIFLNSETLLFLHQIFLKGLCARLENWPTLVLGDLFDMLLPMLCIYQEYVRNHHYSLQVLAEYKQKLEFNNLLKRYEEKPLCESRTLEIFLTYPMHQIPRYIITLHELLAHTPHDHVERQSLEYAKSKLEELSRIMHDEVSETENIRKNLSIERMIVEGCDILLDVNQTFVRQGALLQVFNEKGKFGRGRLGSFSSSFKESKKEVVRQVFLFTNHMLLTTRSSNGRLHLAKILPKDRQHYGKIPLIDCTLIEDPSTEICFFDDETVSVDSSFSLLSVTSGATLLSTQSCERDSRPDYNGLDFKIIVDSKSGPPTTITLVASTHQEKIAWCSDISQCIENLHYSDLLNTSMSESSSVTMPQSVRSDPKLFRDDVDIKFSRTLNSCKVPQIRHASVERLLDRLTDLRFLSIDFLNTFLLTYRVFTTGKTVLEALKRVYKNPECGNLESGSSSCQSSSDTDIYGGGGSPPQFTGEPPSTHKLMIKPHAEKPRRISTGCMNIEVTGSTLSKPPHTQQQSKDLESETTKPKEQQRRVSFHKLERGDSVDTADSDDSRSELASYLYPPRAKLAPIASLETLCDPEITIPDVPAITTNDLLTTGIMLPDVPGESSVDDFDSEYSTEFAISSDNENDLSNTRQSSSYTLVSAASSDTLTPGTPRISPMPSPRISPRMIHGYTNGSPRSMSPRRPCSPSKPLFTGSDFKILDALALSPTSSPIRVIKPHPVSSPIRIPSPIRSTSPSHQISSPIRRPISPGQRRPSSPGPRRPSSPGPRRPSSPGPRRPSSPGPRATSPSRRPSSPRLSSPSRSPSSSPKPRRAPSPISASMSSPNILMPHIKIRPSLAPPPMTAFAVATAGSAYQSDNYIVAKQGQPLREGVWRCLLYIVAKRGSTEVESIGSITPRSSIVTQIEGSPPSAKAGAVVTSSRRSKRRSSSSTAMTAFAVATAGSAYQSEQQQQQQQQGQPVIQPPTTQPQQSSNLPAQPPQQPPKRYLSTGAVVTDPRLLKKRESVISTAATMRVLNIIKHWVSKHQQDFECDLELKRAVIDMLEEMACNTSLVPTEQKAAASILRTITKDNEEIKKVDLTKLLTPPEVSTKDTFDTLSALDIAEQLTYLDHKIYIGIRSEELLGQAWMKQDKSHKAPHVLLVSKRFNEVSRLVVSEIVGRQNLQDRVSCIEKWAAIADICRCMHNYNGVLQICAAFVNSSVYRLKKTWEKLSKQTKQMIERLQVLVSSDGRFKNMRDALHRCDPPCIPYLGMYLTDLSFIEEGTPDNTEEGLVNFSKMRMIAHVIREIRLFQQTPYRIEHHVRITNYLLDPNRLLDDDRTYKASLEIEPKQSRLSTVSLAPS